jgi:uncharacterized protein YndB with AHSA1/START domain
MNTPTLETWTVEHSVETAATPESIWRIWSDVPHWPAWNAGIETIELRGAFATGAEFFMTPPGQRRLRSVLTEVRAPELFTDETRVGDLTVVVAHRIEPAHGGRSRVTYTVTATGEGADEVGPVVSADFPNVLAALVARAEQVPVG